MNRDDTIDLLSSAIGEVARAKGTAVRIQRSVRDGFGMVGVPVIEVEIDGPGDPIRLWHEQGNDFWIEFGSGIPDAAWWSKGDDLEVLAKVIAAALSGRLQVDRGRVTVSVDAKTTIRLAERL